MKKISLKIQKFEEFRPWFMEVSKNEKAAFMFEEFPINEKDNLRNYLPPIDEKYLTFVMFCNKSPFADSFKVILFDKYSEIDEAYEKSKEIAETGVPDNTLSIDTGKRRLGVLADVNSETKDAIARHQEKMDAPENYTGVDLRGESDGS